MIIKDLNDSLFPINRVKIHTDWRREVESGLLKMLVICFGKHKGRNRGSLFGDGKFLQINPGNRLNYH